MSSTGFVDLSHTVTIQTTPAAPVAAMELFAPASVAPMTTVVLFNVTGAAITSVSVGGAVVSPEAGLPPFASGQAPSSCSVQLTALQPSIQVAFGSSGWQSTLLLGGFGTPLSVWCYANGFVVTTASGQLAQVSFWTS